jgi:hypothetical protein
VRQAKYKDRLEIIETFIGGGTEVFPEFYMNIKNNGDKEVVYIKALFRVYDWESDRLKAEKKIPFPRLTIEPGETETLKTSLFDLKYKKDDIIKHEFISQDSRCQIPDIFLDNTSFADTIMAL